MNHGLLWYDSEKGKTLAKKVEDAARYFKKKYGRIPGSCLINTKDAEKLPADTPNPVMVDGQPIRVASWKGILPNHLCLGFDEPESVKPEPKKPEQTDAVSAFERHAQKVST